MEFVCDNVTTRSLERCFVAVDGICCREMLVAGRELHGDGDHGYTAVTADTPR